MSRTSVVLLFAVVLAVAAGYVFANLPGEVPVDVALRPNDTRLISAGQAIYGEHCAECHGKNLEGQVNWRQRDAEGYMPAPPHDETGHTWHHADLLLFQLTKVGLEGITGSKHKTRMPTYGDVLSDEEIVAVLSYIKSRWPKKIRERHDRMNGVASKK